MKLINKAKGTKFKYWFDLSYDIMEQSDVIKWCDHVTIKYE